jgi:hypothetical protein
MSNLIKKSGKYLIHKNILLLHPSHAFIKSGVCAETTSQEYKFIIKFKHKLIKSHSFQIGSQSKSKFQCDGVEI